MDSNPDETTTEQFWKEHAACQKASGISRKAYCHKHQLSYGQLGYWERKWRVQTVSSKLLPVNFNKPPKISDNLPPETVCTLIFKNGHSLKIHDKTVLPLLLSYWG